MPSTSSATGATAPLSPSRCAIVAASSIAPAATRPPPPPGGPPPAPPARPTVPLRQLVHPGPDPIAQHVVVHVLADGPQVRHPVAADERQRGVADRVDVLQLLAQHSEPDLQPGHPAQVAEGEEASPAQLAAEVEDAGPAQHGVVEVEERSLVVHPSEANCACVRID